VRIFITINKVDKRFGSKVIFDEATFSIGEDQKIGIVGRNGSGKSTLCKMILGEDEPDDGEIVLSKHMRLGYIEQHDPFEPDETVLSFLMRYTGKEDWECGKVAGKFQIKNELFNDKLIGELSGGYQTRVKIISMLLQDPNFLILDEPTNFLDVQTQLLMERFLNSYKGGYLIVSHDREFLMDTCSETLDVSMGKLVFYPVKINTFLNDKEERELQRVKTQQNVMIKQKQLQTFINKNRAKASGAAQARNKQKQLDRLTFEERVAPERTVRIKMPHLKNLRKGRALECKELSIGYGEKVIVDNINLLIDKGAHVAILGENGQGKTTFLRTIAEELSLLDGRYKWGHEIEISYYAQHVYQGIADVDTVYSYLERSSDKGVLRQEILNMAGSFLFQNEDVEKSVSVLSGGERARLCMAGMLLKKADVYLFDEPTNHLDFETIEALSRSLKGFNGTVIFVSHSRSFIQSVVNQIVEINDGKLRDFPGGYDEYLYHLKQKMEDPDDVSTISDKSNETGKPQKVDKAKYEQLKKAKNKVKKIEKSISNLTMEKNRLEKKLSSDAEAFTVDNTDLLQKLVTKIEIAEEEYLTLLQEIEQG